MVDLKKIKQFKCLNCGECCQNFLSEKVENTPIEDFNSEFTFLLNKPYLPIYDWEKENFEMELNKINSNRKILPSQVAYDLKNNKVIIINYTLDGQYCPFFNNSKCEIYDKRPHICKQFPCIQDLFKLLSRGIVKVNRNTACKFEREDEYPHNLKLTSMSSREYIQMLDRRYGDELYYNLANTNFTMGVISFLGQFNQENKIRLARKGYNPKYLIRRIQNSEKINISELFTELTGKTKDFLFDLEATKKEFKKNLQEDLLQ